MREALRAGDGVVGAGGSQAWVRRLEGGGREGKRVKVRSRWTIFDIPSSHSRICPCVGQRKNLLPLPFDSAAWSRDWGSGGSLLARRSSSQLSLAAVGSLASIRRESTRLSYLQRSRGQGRGNGNARSSSLLEDEPLNQRPALTRSARYAPESHPRPPPPLLP